MKNKLALCLFCISFSAYTQQIDSPKPVYPLPSERQLNWQRSEMELFVHFTVNTFTGKEWGTGKESPDVFYPKKLDTDQWARVAKETGFARIVLTAKHHDGFCLWPTATTTHSVASSKWMDGKGDVVKLFSESCQKYKIEKGFYLSPWDRNHPLYGSGAPYNQVYVEQLKELLTQYGEVTEQWFDGACGVGADGIQKKQKYDFELFWNTVRTLQPKAVCFSDRGPDARWVGNERGFAGETFWSTIDTSTYEIGDIRSEMPKYLNIGEEGGPDYVIGEADVSIRRPNWFWKASHKTLSLKQLKEVYYRSVGRNAVLMLNIPPNKNGLFDQKDINRLYEFKRELDRIFSKNFAQTATITSDHHRGKSDHYGPSKLNDGDLNTYWATDDNRTSGSFTVKLARPETFNVIMLQEPIQMGQRIKQFKVEALLPNGIWQTISTGTTIGHKRLNLIQKTTTDQLRITIEDSRDVPLISEFGLFLD